jgi:hypothetical protein
MVDDITDRQLVDMYVPPIAIPDGPREIPRLLVRRVPLNYERRKLREYEKHTTNC